MAIDSQLRDADTFDPELLNSAFRGLHTVKGLAGMFRHQPLEDFSHQLETTLDAMRLGKIRLDRAGLDLLFEAVELCEKLLANTDGDQSSLAPAIQPFLARLALLGKRRVEPEPGPSPDSNPDLSPPWLGPILGVLTEFEEHRLRENIRLGRRMLRIHVSFDLNDFTDGIDALKQKLKPHGEVISYLPSADGTDPDQIEIDVLVGSKSTLAEVVASIDQEGVIIDALGTDERVVIGKHVEPVAPEPVVTPPIVDHTARQTVRVDLRKLDVLMNVVGELALVHTNLDDAIDRLARVDPRNEYIRDFQEQLRIMNRRLGLLQHGILEVRMVPIGGLFKTLEVAARRIARDLGKDVRFSISGGDTELDKLIVKGLDHPLMHMVRNAIDHGIEKPDERVMASKPRTGHIALAAYQKGNRVVIELADDGAGIEWRQVRDKAVERGFLSQHEAQNITEAQAVNLIFLPGFTTRDSVSDLSGRGVGMDVVKTSIGELSGMVDVASQPGRGSRFRISLPITLAIIQGLVIDVVGQTYCIPLNSVLESIMVQRDELQTIEGHEVVWIRGRTLPLIHLAKIFELEHVAERRPDAGRRPDARLYVVIVGLAQHRVGLVVDELLGEQDVVIKPIGRALGQVPGIAGATELGNNRTVLVIDVASLVSESIGGVNALAGID
jgi:two-component system, chemotaxis family, sensor kinase CheA